MTKIVDYHNTIRMGRIYFADIDGSFSETYYDEGKISVGYAHIFTGWQVTLSGEFTYTTDSHGNILGISGLINKYNYWNELGGYYEVTIYDFELDVQVYMSSSKTHIMSLLFADNDRLRGSDLNGYGGNDLLEAAFGSSALNGGDGIDGAAYWNVPSGVTASLANPAINTGYASGDTYVSIENLLGSAFNDRFYGDGGANALVGNGGDDLLHGGAGADQLVGGDGIDGAAYWESTVGLTVSLANPSLNTGDAAGDTFSSIENVYGSNFGDRIYGSGGQNALVGNGGDDILNGAGGADALYGGDGVDAAAYWTATAGVWASLISPATNRGDAVGDTYFSIENLLGSAFDDQLRGNDGANFINGNNGNDVLYGFGGNDQIHGGNGDDRLVGGTGDDTLYGGAGADTFFGVNGNGRDRIVDWQDGIDHIDLKSVSGVNGFAQLTVSNVSTGALITWGNGANGFLLYGQSAAVVDASDFVF